MTQEQVQIFACLIILVFVFILTRMFIGWRMRKAALKIIDDLKKQNAYTADSAMELPYARKNWMKLGRRDYEGKAFEGLLAAGAVIMTEEGRYYLSDPNLGR